MPEDFRPYWPDGCMHQPAEFLGTVLEDGLPVDVYVFVNSFEHQRGDGGFGTCARYGELPEQYRSGPAPVGNPSSWTAADFLIMKRLYEIAGVVRPAAEVVVNLDDFVNAADGGRSILRRVVGASDPDAG